MRLGWSRSVLSLTFFIGTSVVSLQGQRQPEPKLPVIDFDACGSANPRLYSGPNKPYKLEEDDRLYSSWQDNRRLLRNLRHGTEVTRVGAVNIIREPDRGVLTGNDPSFRPLAQGDEVLGYGLHSDSLISFWGKGVSFKESYENIALKGSCGFADQTQCHVNITKPGVQEWWMQLKIGNGVTGWILGFKQNGDEVLRGPNAGYACRD
jgi:hypothetical protein